MRFARITVVIALAVVITACSNGGGPEEPSTPKSDEAAAAGSFAAINQAQQDFIRRTRRYALTFTELIEAKLLNQRPSKEALGYEVTLRPSADAVSYTVIATPLSPSPSARHLFTDNSGIIRAQENQPATADSPPR